MTQTDKEKIKDTLDHITQLIEGYKVDRDDFANVGANSQAQLLAGMIKDLEKLQDIIEEYRN